MMPSPNVPRLKNMVEMILKENPKLEVQGRRVEVRNSDIALTIVIWQRWYSVGTNPDSVVHLYRLFDLPREDNVKRVRAYWQNVEHKYMPTDPDVLIKRGIEEEYWEEALGYRLTKEDWQEHHRTRQSVTPPKEITQPDIFPKVVDKALDEVEKQEQVSLLDVPPEKPRRYM